MNKQSLHLMTSNVLLPPMISAFVPFKKSVPTPGYESPFLHFFLIRPILWLEMGFVCYVIQGIMAICLLRPHSCSVGLTTFIVFFPHKIAVNQWPCIRRSASDHCLVCRLIFLSLWEYRVELAVRFVRFIVNSAVWKLRSSSSVVFKTALTILCLLHILLILNNIKISLNFNSSCFGFLWKFHHPYYS